MNEIRGILKGEAGGLVNGSGEFPNTLIVSIWKILVVPPPSAILL